MYKTMNGWTKESMVKHIKENFKGKSVDTNGLCLYRNAEGKKCAIGLFIPDEIYVSRMEGIIGFRQMIHTYNLESYLPLNIEGSKELQVIHDNSKVSATLDDMLKWIENNVTDEVVNG